MNYIQVLNIKIYIGTKWKYEGLILKQGGLGNTSSGGILLYPSNNKRLRSFLSPYYPLRPSPSDSLTRSHSPLMVTNVSHTLISFSIPLILTIFSHLICDVEFRLTFCGGFSGRAIIISFPPLLTSYPCGPSNLRSRLIRFHFSY